MATAKLEPAQTAQQAQQAAVAPCAPPHGAPAPGNLQLLAPTSASGAATAATGGVRAQAGGTALAAGAAGGGQGGAAAAPLEEAAYGCRARCVLGAQGVQLARRPVEQRRQRLACAVRRRW